MATTKQTGPMPGIEDKPMMDKGLTNVAEMAEKLRGLAGLSPDERLPEPDPLFGHITPAHVARMVRKAPAVYEAIRNVSGELAKTGIGKDSKNAQQNYSFRGIDQVMNGLSPALVQHGLVVVPRMLSRDVVERQTKSGSLQFFVTVCAEFTLVAVADGSMHAAITYGEAQDTADKATNKAMSAAYKYFAFLTFCIPTEAMLDADATTPEESVASAAPSPSAPPKPKPDIVPEWVLDLEAVADNGLAALEAAWDQVPIEKRNELLKLNVAKWNALKARARAAKA